MIRLALIAALALGGCNAVLYDPGGNLGERDKQLAKEAKSNAKVKLPYECDSSCAEQLFDPDVCVRRPLRPLFPQGTVIGVHAATNDFDGSISTGGNAYVLYRFERYPKFQARVIADRAQESTTMTYYSATTMHSFGVPYC